ncbi:Uncharacterised protein [Mycobacterium tuberculosis]|nr:Uncharacterised protein [Mycobacterium tuberculosis]
MRDPERRAVDPDHGMPADVADNLRAQVFLKSTGPHSPATVRRRLANWSTLTKWRGLDGAFASPQIRDSASGACGPTDPEAEKRQGGYRR